MDDETGSDRPKAYEDGVDALSSTRPRVAAALGRAHANRVEALPRLERGMRMAGLDQLLTHLDAARASSEQGAGSDRRSSRN